MTTGVLLEQTLFCITFYDLQKVNRNIFFVFYERATKNTEYYLKKKIVKI